MIFLLVQAVGLTTQGETQYLNQHNTADKGQSTYNELICAVDRKLPESL